MLGQGDDLEIPIGFRHTHHRFDGRAADDAAGLGILQHQLVGILGLARLRRRKDRLGLFQARRQHIRRHGQGCETGSRFLCQTHKGVCVGAFGRTYNQHALPPIMPVFIELLPGRALPWR
jgi:hypothetical protein